MSSYTSSKTLSIHDLRLQISHTIIPHNPLTPPPPPLPFKLPPLKLNLSIILLQHLSRPLRISLVFITHIHRQKALGQLHRIKLRFQRTYHLLPILMVRQTAPCGRADGVLAVECDV